MLGRLGFKIARTSWGGKLSRWVVTHMSFLMPVHRLRETPKLLVFYHPRPVYPIHILIVPKQPFTGLQDLTEADGNLLAEVFKTVNELVTELSLEKAGYRVVVNGGRYQEVPHLHFHLISGSFKHRERPRQVGRPPSGR